MQETSSFFAVGICPKPAGSTRRVPEDSENNDWWGAASPLVLVAEDDGVRSASLIAWSESVYGSPDSLFTAFRGEGDT